jgi:apolipoprotein N-acyltransferase
MKLRRAQVHSRRQYLAGRATRWACAAGLPPSLALSAVLMAISLGTPGHGWLAWFALLPLLAAARTLPPVAAALAGAGWGFLLYGAAASGLVAAIPRGAGSIILIAMVPAAYACLGALATRALGFAPVVLGLLWILAEVALQPLGLRSGLLASTQPNGTMAAWVAGLLGYVFAAFALVYANALLLDLLSGVRLPPLLSQLSLPCPPCGDAPARPVLLVAASRPRRLILPRGPPNRRMVG